jgi:hypothetical protein
MEIGNPQIDRRQINRFFAVRCCQHCQKGPLPPPSVGKNHRRRLCLSRVAVAGYGGALLFSPQSGSLPLPLCAPLLVVVQALMIAVVLIPTGAAHASNYASFTPKQRFVAKA